MRHRERQRRLWPHWAMRDDAMNANVGSDLGGWIVSSHASRNRVEYAREEAQ